jgi:hypothetical protein
MNPVDNYLERPLRYYNIDGVGELGIGFMMLGFALIGWLQLHTPSTAIWHQMYAFFIYVAVMLSIIHYGSKAIKTRITYPRTGFVDYRPRDKYWIPMILGFTVSALLSAGLILAVRRHWEVSTPVSLAGLLIALPYIRIARTVRWKWAIFGLMAAGAAAIALLPADLLGALANHTGLTSAVPAKAAGAFWLTFTVYGILLIASGGISLWSYLPHTQPPAQEPE